MLAVSITSVRPLTTHCAPELHFACREGAHAPKQGFRAARTTLSSKEIIRVPQSFLCRPARHKKSEPSLEGHCLNASAVRKT
jgi:hypothetical protein